MKSETVEYFLWKDIETQICKEMGITETHFRNYNEVIGGPYKDLWHEWLNYFDTEVRNDTIVANDLGERMECKLDWVKENDKEWLVPFVKAVYKVFDKYGVEHIKYSW